MTNQPRHDPRFPRNMVPDQSGTPGYRDPRSYQQTTGRPGTMNSQQPSPSPQAFDASSWNNPALASQYYGYSQPAPQDPYSNSTSFMPPHQNVQSFPPMSFGNSSYQARFDPAAQMLQNWTMAHSVYGSGMPNAGQQYSVQQASMQQTPFQQAAFQQTPVQQAQVQPQTDTKQDPEAIETYSGDYDNFDMEDDPSAQLMAELTQDIPESSYSPTPAFETDDAEHENVNQGWGDSMVNAAGFELDDSVFYAPQIVQSAESQNFRSFEYENTASEAQRVEEEELDQQVDQVISGLGGENMQDAIVEEQTLIPHTPPTYQKYDIDIYMADEDSASEREVSVPADNTEHYDDLPAGHVEVSGDVADNDVDEEDAMSDEGAEEHAIEDGLDQEEVFDHNPEQEESDEDTIEGDVAEEEDNDIDISDTATPPAQDAHDSGVEESPQVQFEGHMLTESPLKTIKKAIASKEDKELHHKAWKLQPHHLSVHRYWVAILMHTVSPQKVKVEKDFVWLKGSRINTVETMWNKYRDVTTEEQHQILFCGKIPQFTDTMEALDRFGDRLIVFRAAKQEVVEIE